MLGYLVQIGPDGKIPDASKIAADNVCSLVLMA